MDGEVSWLEMFRGSRFYLGLRDNGVGLDSSTEYRGGGGDVYGIYFEKGGWLNLS